MSIDTYEVLSIYTTLVSTVCCAGDLQSILLAMRDSAYEASVALSAFAGITKGHTTLTSDCGSMLEEVCCIHQFA